MFLNVLSKFSAIQIWQSYQVRGHVMSNVLHAERGLGWDWLSWPIALLLWGLVCGTFHGLDEQDLPIHAQWIKCGSSKKNMWGRCTAHWKQSDSSPKPYSLACAMLRSKEDIRVLWDKLDRGCDRESQIKFSGFSRLPHFKYFQVIMTWFSKSFQQLVMSGSFIHRWNYRQGHDVGPVPLTLGRSTPHPIPSPGTRCNWSHGPIWTRRNWNDLSPGCRSALGLARLWGAYIYIYIYQCMPFHHLQSDKFQSKIRIHHQI